MRHLLRKAQNDSSPEHPERAAAEQLDSVYIPENMHQPQTVNSDHQHQQHAHKTERAINHEMCQPGTRQTQQITYRLAVLYASRMIQRQDRLIVHARE